MIPITVVHGKLGHAFSVRAVSTFTKNTNEPHTVNNYKQLHVNARLFTSCFRCNINSVI